MTREDKIDLVAASMFAGRWSQYYQTYVLCRITRHKETKDWLEKRATIIRNSEEDLAALVLADAERIVSAIERAKSLPRRQIDAVGEGVWSVT